MKIKQTLLFNDAASYSLWSSVIYGDYMDKLVNEFKDSDVYKPLPFRQHKSEIDINLAGIGVEMIDQNCLNSVSINRKKIIYYHISREFIKKNLISPIIKIPYHAPADIEDIIREIGKYRELIANRGFTYIDNSDIKIKLLCTDSGELNRKICTIGLMCIPNIDKLLSVTGIKYTEFNSNRIIDITDFFDTELDQGGKLNISLKSDHGINYPDIDTIGLTDVILYSENETDVYIHEALSFATEVWTSQYNKSISIDLSSLFVTNDRKDW